MLQPEFLYQQLQQRGVEFTLGVPDSLLKYYCSYAFDQGSQTIAANEGGAIGMAAGYHLATGKIPLVYLQNSGFGNIINPLTSLIDESVYAIPMLIMVGWRGMPGTKDAPQHHKQGQTMEAQLKAYELPYHILSSDEQEVPAQLDELFSVMKEQSKPAVLLVPPNTFESYTLQNPASPPQNYTLKREEALEVMLRQMEEDSVIISTTGKTSRELFELRERLGQGHDRDFLTVGSMGHASQIALGVAQHSSKNVFCIDGDGAMIMHMGSLAIIGELQPANFKHILINNGAHESVGGQPTAGFSINFGMIAKGCGYKHVLKAASKEELEQLWPEFISKDGPVLLEIMTQKGARSDLGRPTISPAENKKYLMSFLSDSK